MSFERVAVLGLGKVGLLAATLLHEAGFQVVGVDTRPPRSATPFPTRVADMSSASEVEAALGDSQAVLSCLPYHLNLGLAEVAHALGLHYFDLTEDVPTTKAIIQMSETVEGVMAPQCGLAPGFVGIVAASQIAQFDECRSLRLRVGALPQHPTGLLGYAFNWSPEGVVNEYLNDAEVIEAGVRKTVSSMEWKETLIIDGRQLEAFTTSGGLGTMCETYHGVVANIDYKTIRYPGHMDLMNFFFHELLMRERRELAGEILTHAKPPVDDDVVYIHVAVGGHGARSVATHGVRARVPSRGGRRPAPHRHRLDHGRLGGVGHRARAPGHVAARGFIKQEHIPLAAFLTTPTGALFTRS